MTAFVLRLSGLRDIARFQGGILGTTNFSSLSHALSREVSLRFVRHLVQTLEGDYRPGRDELVALDSMPVTLSASLPHRCTKYNRDTVGGGVLWSYALGARKGCCPVKIHKVMAGPWGDAKLMKEVALLAGGPIYLMDRGFGDYGLIGRWLVEHVRFILRLRDNTRFEILKTLSSARRYGTGRIDLDAMVRLGSERTEAHPVVRLIIAHIETRAGIEPLVVTTSEAGWSAERVLDAYNERQKIEQFHQFLKSTLGLAHLYNFSQTGLEFLLYTAVLLAMIIFLFGEKAGKDVLDSLHLNLSAWRESCLVGRRWRRNMNANKGDKGKKARARLQRKRLRNL